MVRTGHMTGILAAAMIVAACGSATAEVLDAVYNGTMVCDRMPFTNGKMREHIAVTIDGGKATYRHVVRLRDAEVETTAEQGTGTVSGQNIDLQGSWKGGAREYQAKYSGTFVRRSVKLKGAQTWADGGKTFTRACSGAVKRRLKPFLPRKPAAA